MPRLPHPGADEGTWGDILNDFLSQSHTGDGGLKPGIVGAIHLQNNAVTPAKISAAVPVAGQVLSYDGSSFTWITSPAGVTDHSLLSGLSDDDHPQYHTDVRGDARYYTQAQVDASLAGKANVSHGHAVADVTNLQAIIDGKAAVTHTHTVADTSGLQAALDAKANVSHTHEASEIANLTTDLDEKAPLTSPTFTGTVTLETVTITGGNPGIGKVLTSNAGGNAAWQAAAGVTDHTQLSNIGTNTHAQIDTAVADSVAHIANISNPHSVTKAQVGLSSVDNTSDANKPVSTATQTALDSKADVSHTHVVGRTYPYSHSGDLSVLTGAHRLYNDTGATLTITKVRASVGTAPTGADVLVDVNLDGTTIFTGGVDRPQIAAVAFTDVGVPAVTAWPDGSYLTVDIDQIGSTAAGADLTVTITAI